MINPLLICKSLSCVYSSLSLLPFNYYPVSTVAIGLAVGLNGLAAGSAALFAACTAVLPWFNQSKK